MRNRGIHFFFGIIGYLSQRKLDAGLKLAC